MSFYSGELRAFDLCKMNEGICKKFIVKTCSDGLSYRLEDKDKHVGVEELLKNSGQLYFLFGEREGKYLSCANNKKYLIDDELKYGSKGINMADVYINPYEDINLGFLISYDNGKIEIQPAIEGESIECRRYEIVDNCGDLNNEMKEFINKYIL